MQLLRSSLPGLSRRGREKQPVSVDPFDLDARLIMLPGGEPWTTRDACTGVQVFGAIGSGKTSGSGAAIAQALLARGFGGLVLCAKPEERALWEEYARRTGRSDDLIIVSPTHPSHPCRFNYMGYELQRAEEGAGLTQNIVKLLSTVAEIVEGRPDQEGLDFWKRSAQELFRNAIDVIYPAHGTVSLELVSRLIVTAPQSANDVKDPEWWSSSFCAETLKRSKGVAKSPEEEHDYTLALEFWLETFPRMADRMRSSITATFSSMADVLNRGLVYALLGTETELVPDVAFRARKVIVLDLPVQEYGDAGRIVQGIWKYMFQKAVERRDVTRYPLPVFLWADEAQNFVSSYDFLYQSVCRSARGITVYLTQNISNYYALLGNRDQANSLLGNFQNKIFHANADAPTNAYASEVIASEVISLGSGGASTNPEGERSTSFNVSQSIQPKVLPAEFTMLRTGGPANNFTVEAIWFQGGRRFIANQGHPFLRTSFHQRRER